MAIVVRQELAGYGQRIADRRLTAGPGGNISAREGRLLWVKPSGFAMEDLAGKDMVCVDLETGRLVEGKHRPTSELPMHLAVYRARPDIRAVFHTHSPWASGAVTSDADVRPMFAEVVNDLGGVAVVPYLLTGSTELADAVAEAAKENETIFMVGHGVVTIGKSMKQAYYRCCVAEDAAKAFIAASIVGKPKFLTDEQIEELKQLEAGEYRRHVAEREE
jgi:L-fuculose-phosphate aldolase